MPAMASPDKTHSRVLFSFGEYPANDFKYADDKDKCSDNVYLKVKNNKKFCFG